MRFAAGFATDQIHAGDAVTPLVGTADLKRHAMIFIECQEVVSLD